MTATTLSRHTVRRQICGPQLTKHSISDRLTANYLKRVVSNSTRHYNVHGSCSPYYHHLARQSAPEGSADNTDLAQNSETSLFQSLRKTMQVFIRSLLPQLLHTHTHPLSQPRLSAQKKGVWSKAVGDNVFPVLPKGTRGMSAKM